MLKEVVRPNKGVEIEVIEVTPSVAESWLTKNTKNRVPRQRFVDQFSRDMTAGRWRITGDAIRFDTNGDLIDGQKRLMACVASGVPFQSCVIYNLPPETRDFIDVGQVRSNSDVLTMRGINNANNVATTFRILTSEKNGVMHVGGNTIITHAELLSALQRHPKLPNYVIMPGKFPRGIPIGVFSYIYYVGAVLLKERERAQEMIKVLTTGEPYYKGDPIHGYREKVIKNYETVQIARGRLAIFNTAKLAWNAFAKRETVSTLRWHSDPVAIDGLDLRKL